MRERLPSFNYHAPQTISEVIRYLSELQNAVILAGGTDLIVAMKQKGLKPYNIVSLKKLKDELCYIRQEDGKILIGAMTTFDLLEKSSIIRKYFKVLHEAIGKMAAYQIRNMATIGGNLCNASPAADSAPPLLVLNAKLRVIGPEGDREIPIERFFLGPGKTALQKGEILKEIEIPVMPPNSGAAFIKLGRRRSEDISIASASAFIQLEDESIKDVRIALGSVAPTPIRAYEAERILRGKETSERLFEEAGERAMKECNPITDVRASAEYRRAMVKVLTKNALKTAVNRSIEVEV
jgi:carbon-monoxide dehydrogenase medium subunit